MIPTDPVLESPGARRPTEESSAPTGGLGAVNGWRRRRTGQRRCLGQRQKQSGLQWRILEMLVPCLSLETLEGMVGHIVRPPSPQVAPLAVEEEDKVEEIEHEESRPQAI